MDNVGQLQISNGIGTTAFTIFQNGSMLFSTGGLTVNTGGISISTGGFNVSGGTSTFTGVSGGTIKIVDTNQSTGRVLTSDAAGDGTWKVPADGLLTAWQTISGPYTALAGDQLMVDTTTAAVSVTLPAAPNVGDTVNFVDLGGNFATNNLTIVHNGNNIMSLGQDMTVSTNYVSFTLVFWNATYGWKIK
jgi:hypothetical protein